MQPIRILQVFTVLNRGGAETMIMNYYRHMDRSKVQFDFLVHRQEPGVYEEEIKRLGGRIYRMPPLYPRYFHSYKKQIKAFFDEHPEYCIVHGHVSELGYFLYKEAYKHHVPVIIGHAHSSKMQLDIKAPCRWYWKHACRKYITHPFGCSIDSAKWLFGNKIKEKAMIMNNAVDIKVFGYQAETAERLRRNMGLEGKVVLGHVGRFKVEKNHKFLIFMFAELKKEIPNSVLILIGQGELEEKMRKQIKQMGIEADVIFLGERADVNELLCIFDFLVFPSLYEGLPVTVIEAQASGVKCLVSNSITTDVDMGMQLVDYLPITETKLWIDKIKDLVVGLDKLRENRLSDLGKIKAKGYDITEEAKMIQDFYLDCHKGGTRTDETTDYRIYPNV